MTDTHVDPSEFPDHVPTESAFSGPADPVRGPLYSRPATTTATLASALVLVASRAGVDLSVEEAVTFIAAATIVVGWFSPRR